MIIEAFCAKEYLYPILVRVRKIPGRGMEEAYFLLRNHLYDWVSIPYKDAVLLVEQHPGFSEIVLPEYLRAEFQSQWSLELDIPDDPSWVTTARKAPYQQYSLAPKLDAMVLDVGKSYVLPEGYDDLRVFQTGIDASQARRARLLGEIYDRNPELEQVLPFDELSMDDVDSILHGVGSRFDPQDIKDYVQLLRDERSLI